MSPSIARVAAGTLIADRYRAIDFRGGGSDGDVYKVFDEYLSNEVALKLLAPKGPGKPATWDEAQILEQVRSEYLLPVLNADVVPGGDLRYITTTLMTNGDLESAAQVRGVSPEQAVRWGHQIAHGLDRVHVAKLVHRDVKPGNCFLDAGNAAMLGDLGMAEMMDPDGFASPYGTFATVAPEVLGHPPFYQRPTGQCSVRSDVYSLGATIFYLVSGEYPVSHKLAAADMAQRIIAGQRRRLRDLAPYASLGLSRVVEQALSTDPSRRQPTALALGNQLSSCRHHPRCWRRVAEHPGHQMCFRGDAARSVQAIDVCVVAAGAYAVDVEVRKAGGQRIKQYSRSAVRAPKVPQVLRALFPQI